MNLDQKKNHPSIIPHVRGLDGLRAIAVIAVFAYHLGVPYTRGGFLGVDLFFVLSGFLITSILVTQNQERGKIDIIDFWKRRARRLVPALVLMLFCVAVWIFLFAPERLAVLWPEMPAAMFYYSNWYLILNEASYFEQFGPPTPFGHLWSLAIEGQFYIIWPIFLGFLLRFLKRKEIIAITVAITAASAAAMVLLYAPGFDPSRVYYGTDTRIFALLLGALTAMFVYGRKLSLSLPLAKRYLLEIAGIVGLSAVLFMMYKIDEYGSFTYQGGLILFAAAVACLVAVVSHPASAMSRLLEFRPLRWIGECSYGIYLWHLPVIVFTTPAVNTNGFNFSRSLMQVALTLILAAASRYLVENPIRYRKYRASTDESPKPRAFPGAAMKVLAMALAVLIIPLASAEKIEQLFAVDHVEHEILLERETSVEPELPAEDVQYAENTEELATGPGDDITVIGDSVIVGVEPYLKERLPGITVDAKESRQLWEVTEVIEELKNTGKLKKTVIVALGTNGPFGDAPLVELVDLLSGAEKIIFINTRVPKKWESAVNDSLERVLSTYDNVTLLDWYKESSGHDEYFRDDGVHLKKAGADAYCSLIIDALALLHEND